MSAKALVSAHKCEGMTLDRVEIDLSRAFEHGMVYVALSRIKSLEGLRLTGFDPQKIIAHPKVRIETNLNIRSADASIGIDLKSEVMFDICAYS
ncbi:hypothetical protein SUGI_0690360 [Cryptomeria japonica]|nr:hypothetical protein SUGI_0690360 [Cryptomeria japonica]